MEKILKHLIKTESADTKKYIYFMLLKFSNQLQSITNRHEYTPLLYIHNRNILLVYEDEETGLKSTFSKPEDILFLLPMLFSEGNQVFFLYESDEDILDKGEILKKINESLDINDEQMFVEYSEKLKYFEKEE